VRRRTLWGRQQTGLGTRWPTRKIDTEKY